MSDKESYVTKCHLTIWGGVNHTDDLPLKSPSMIYPPSNHPILSKISDTQHHALLHKGLFYERPIIKYHPTFFLGKRRGIWFASYSD